LTVNQVRKVIWQHTKGYGINPALFNGQILPDTRVGTVKEYSYRTGPAGTEKSHTGETRDKNVINATLLQVYLRLSLSLEPL
jgi:hypothetical protein